MKHDPINFKEKLSAFSEHWSPKVIAQMNDYQFKLVKIQGHFTWHGHPDTDEVFIVLEGDMSIDFREDPMNLSAVSLSAVKLSAGEMFVVPKGVEHKPYAKNECKILLIEPEGVVNTGESDSELTAENDVWI